MPVVPLRNREGGWNPRRDCGDDHDRHRAGEVAEVTEDPTSAALASASGHRRDRSSRLPSQRKSPRVALPSSALFTNSR